MLVDDARFPEPADLLFERALCLEDLRDAELVKRFFPVQEAWGILHFDYAGWAPAQPFERAFYLARLAPLKALLALLEPAVPAELDEAAELKRAQARDDEEAKVAGPELLALVYPLEECEHSAFLHPK